MLLTSVSPQHVLNEASILNELSVADTAQIDQCLNAARQLLSSVLTSMHREGDAAAVRMATNLSGGT